MKIGPIGISGASMWSEFSLSPSASEVWSSASPVTPPNTFGSSSETGIRVPPGTSSTAMFPWMGKPFRFTGNVFVSKLARIVPCGLASAAVANAPAGGIFVCSSPWKISTAVSPIGLSWIDTGPIVSIVRAWALIRILVPESGITSTPLILIGPSETRTPRCVAAVRKQPCWAMIETIPNAIR